MRECFADAADRREELCPLRRTVCGDTHDGWRHQTRLRRAATIVTSAFMLALCIVLRATIGFPAHPPYQAPVGQFLTLEQMDADWQYDVTTTSLAAAEVLALVLLMLTTITLVPAVLIQSALHTLCAAWPHSKGGRPPAGQDVAEFAVIAPHHVRASL